jgi:hypothetical protein
MNKIIKFNYDHKGMISLWAVSECAIGGVMHGMKIPFTGIIVGGISVVCLYFIAKYSENKKAALIEATATVLAIKLMASPHSPWQAYVAVIFQSMMALLFLSHRKINPIQILLFTVINQLESALQRVLIMVLVFGKKLFIAIDESASKIIESLGFEGNLSLMTFIFGVYILLHLITGVILGFWIPRLEKDVEKLNQEAPIIDDTDIEWSPQKNKKIWLMVIFVLIIPLALSFIMNDKSYLLIFVRAIAISTLFIFIVTPLIKRWVKAMSGKKYNKGYLEDILGQLPKLINHYSKHIKWASHAHSGFARIKYILVALVYASSTISEK